MRSFLMWIIAAAASAVLAACSTDNGQAPQTIADRLPALPGGSADLPGGEKALPGHRAAAERPFEIAGEDYYDASPDAIPGSGAVTFFGSPNSLSWAIYQLPGVGEDYLPLSFHVDVSSVVGGYWVAFADYTEGNWRIQDEPYAASTTIDAPTPWPRYISEADNMYIAVLVWQSSLRIDRVTATMDDNRPLIPPSGLAATPGRELADLAWDEYTDYRATELRVYISQDPGMAGATLEATTTTGDTSAQVTGLAAGETYYFGLKAYNADDEVESDYSNIDSAVPTGGPGPGYELAAGTWPRLGNRADGCGCTDLIGPATMEYHVSAQLTENGETDENRTSPVIDSRGRVYALSRDGLLSCYDAELSTRNWRIDSRDLDPPELVLDYVCPPHSPAIDADGNVYFIVVEQGTDAGAGFLFSVNQDGIKNWHYDLGVCFDDNEMPWPSPNFDDEGHLLVVKDDLQVIVALEDATTAGWTNSDMQPGAQIFADALATSAGNIEMPVWFSGMGIPEDPKPQWFGVKAADGVRTALFEAMGARLNIYSGLPLGGAYYVFPQSGNMILIESSTGTWINQVIPLSLPGRLQASPSRDAAGANLFQLAGPRELPDLPRLCWVTSDNGDPPSLNLAWSLLLDGDEFTPPEAHSKPAIDGDDNIYFTDTDGRVYKVHFDSRTPPGPANPEILGFGRPGRSDSYFYNSVAIGDGAVYTVTEQNVLYRFENRE